MRRYALSPLFAVALALIAAVFSADARASVSISVTWEGLLRESTAAAVLTPVESHAAWENGRIWTYTRLHVDRVIAGDLATGSDAWVRTMGGVVGEIGQVVEGEAILAPGQPSLLFLRAGPPGAFEVTARGQGQFPVVAEKGGAPARLIRNRAAGELLAPRHVVVSTVATRLAGDVLHDRAVDDAAREVAGDWVRMHAHP